MASRVQCQRAVCEHNQAGSCLLPSVVIGVGGGCDAFEPLRICGQCDRYGTGGCPVQSFAEAKDAACVELFVPKPGDPAPEWLLEASQEPPDPLTEPTWWVPTARHLPPEELPVLLRVFCRGDGYRLIAAYVWGKRTGGQWELDDYPEPEDLAVTHWMAMPPDPQGEEMEAALLAKLAGAPDGREEAGDCAK